MEGCCNFLQGGGRGEESERRRESAADEEEAEERGGSTRRARASAEGVWKLGWSGPSFKDSGERREDSAGG